MKVYLLDENLWLSLKTIINKIKNIDIEFGQIVQVAAALEQAPCQEVEDRKAQANHPADAGKKPGVAPKASEPSAPMKMHKKRK